MAKKQTKSGKSATETLKPSQSLSPELFLQRLKEVVSATSEKKNLSLATLFAEAKLRPPLVLLGNQHIRIKRTISWTKEQLFSGSGSEVSTYFGTDLNNNQQIELLSSAIKSPSLFSRRRLIIIYEAEKIKANAQKSLIPAFEKADPAILALLTAETLGTKSSFISEIAALGTIIELGELKGEQLRKWIIKEVSRSGIASGIDSDALDLLLKCHGENVSSYAHEIEKLSLLVTPGEQINKSLVEKISLKAPEVTSFELIRQIAAKKAAIAVSLCNDLVDQGMHQLQISSFLIRCFRVLLSNKDKNPNVALPADLSNRWFIGQLGNSLSAFSAAELRSSIKQLGKLDFELKDSKLPPQLALTKTVQKIALRKA